MKKSLTSKQKIVLSTITDLTHKKGVPPTLDELREELGYSSISSVQRHTDALKQKRYLSDSRGLSLPISTEKIQIPLVGNVACGIPLLAVENIEAYISIDADSISGQADDYFFLRAVGDSMNMARIRGRNIENGDYVLVRKQNTADIGSRIVALIGDEATIKKMERGEGCIKLKPETDNPANKPIYVFDDFSIQGVVSDVFKKGDE